MALIKCPECGKEISENCKVCPNCGLPNSYFKKAEKEIRLKRIMNDKTLSVLLILVGLCLLYFSYYNAYRVIYYILELGISYSNLLLAIIFLVLSIPMVFVGLKRLTANNRIYNSITILLLVICPIIIAKGAFDELEWNSQKSDVRTEYTEKKTNRFMSIENMQKDLDGTIWTWTESLSDRDREMYKFWKRFEFKNGKLYVQSAAPSKGEWGEPHEFDYTIEERRYSDTGRKFIAVIITGLSYFVPTTGQYVEPYMFDYDEMMVRKMREKDYEWD